MATLERAARLLRGAISIDRVGDVLHELGFTEPLMPLDRTAITRLQLPASLGSVRIARGVGSIRALAVELGDDDAAAAAARETLSAIANALARNASGLLWLVCAIRSRPSELAIICWTSRASGIRVVSLVCRPDRVIQSDAETLCRLAAARDDSDLLTHARWLDVLGREEIRGRFFRGLERTVNELAASLTGRIEPAERRELALLYISRLIFLSFLETKGWLNGDFSFLANGFTQCIQSGGRYQRRILEPLFFGTLNTRVRARSARARAFGRIPFLNGGLFSRSPLEKRRRGSVFSDESFGNAFGYLLSRYRFSGREDSADWSEASIDPEILGKAFETLMASADRQRSGAFYTPQDLVERLTSHTLASALRDYPAPPESLDGLGHLRILDPACGSGAFLVHVLERLASLRRAAGETGTISEIRRRVLTTSIFGVDLNPMAVWLCELRLWLSIVVESEESDPMLIAPLPNLDRHIRIGDSLAGSAFDALGALGSSRRIAGLRARYVRATGRRKASLARDLDRIERKAAVDVLASRKLRLTTERGDLLAMLRGRDLFGIRHPPDPATRVRLDGLRREIRRTAQEMKALRDGAALPFSFASHFSDVAAGGGFDVVIGNPPWVRVHHIARLSRARLKQDFVVYRQAAWQLGAEGAGAGRGFAAQIDLAALFVERGCDLLRAGGTLGYLLPSKLWRSLAGGGLRALLLEHADIVLIEDLSGAPSQFDASVYPSLLVSRKRKYDFGTPENPAPEAPPRHRIILTIRSADTTQSWRCAPQRLSVDGSPGSPWLLLPGPARRAFAYVTSSSAPLRVTRFERPMLGVKTGCNAAYLVRVESKEGPIARITAAGRTGEIESEILRPAMRGESIEQWHLTGKREHIVWTHCEDGSPRSDLPPLARSWLAAHVETLTGRTDLRRSARWWSMFRTESARFDRPRVAWADIGLRPRAIVIAEGDPAVPINSCYVVRCRKIVDAHALAAILNGPLAAAWLNAIAEPARGGYHRYLGWTIAMLPLPMRWNRARTILGPLGERAMAGSPPSDAELLAATLDAYRLHPDRVAPLLAWSLGWD